ncbi:MAG: hypothetical protein A3D44_04410 [Candidatus Staskawiczbacteria bacterium RIFCSPHIGHO2_02_FULL_42_22]|uniref:Uncharacterized protein n=1 Tax=Candidatus Staskawiczbacteria bacterium RIFCSPHIGHO2_02_FULL_42_22 TaxID=1802207 RepID=A0A1G2I557_9BACT|nr:MAG: hypothetical protein A3D44_04410 [Candidatus Staskawiczbacteria bacterium RIFCSPHIGHO2_02_FULL_42_22]
MPKEIQQITKKDIQNKIAQPGDRVFASLDRMEKNICGKLDALILKCENFLKRPPVKYKY